MRASEQPPRVQQTLRTESALSKGGWGSSRGCQKSIEMLILLVFLRENTKSTPGKKEAKERGRLGLQEKGGLLLQ